MLALLALLTSSTITETCATVCVIAGAVKLLLETVESGQRVKRSLAKSRAEAASKEAVA